MAADSESCLVNAGKPFVHSRTAACWHTADRDAEDEHGRNVLRMAVFPMPAAPRWSASHWAWRAAQIAALLAESPDSAIDHFTTWRDELARCRERAATLQAFANREAAMSAAHSHAFRIVRDVDRGRVFWRIASVPDSCSCGGEIYRDITPTGNVWHCLRALGEILRGNEWPTQEEVFDYEQIRA